MVVKIWIEMSTTNIQLLQFKIQSHLQKHELWMPVHQKFRTHTEEKSSKNF